MLRHKSLRQPDPDHKPGLPGPGKSKNSRSVLAEENKKDRLKVPQEETRAEENDPSGEYRRTVTNTDEQEKITNAQNSDTPFDEREREGV